MEKKTFLICPIRGASEEEVLECEKIVNGLEYDGWVVHWPYRDTNQQCETGFEICKENRDAIEDADVVHIIYKAESFGSHFDLGMAFVARKEIIPITLPKETEGKSFPAMIREWNRRGNVA